MKALPIFIVLVIINISSLKSQWINCNDGFREYRLGQITLNSIGQTKDKFYIGTENFGVYESDNGAYWVINYNGNHALDIASLYTIKGEWEIAVANTSWGLYLSPDQGGSWFRMKINTANFELSDFTYSNDIYYISSNQGIHISKNKGSSWTKSNIGSGNMQVYCLSNWNSRIFAGTEKGLYYTIDSGATWTLCSNNIDSKPIYSTLIYKNKLFAGGEGKYFISSDMGSTWVEKRDTVLKGKITQMYTNSYNNFILLSQNKYLYFAFKPDTTLNLISSQFKDDELLDVCVIDENILLNTSSGIYQSGNRGKNWYKQNSKFFNEINVCFTTAINSQLYIGLVESGFLKTKDNGLNWEPINYGIQNVDPYYRSIIPKDNLLFACTAIQVYSSSDMGDYWSLCSKGIDENCEIYCLGAHENSLFCGTSIGLYSSSDNGKNWTLNNKIQNMNVYSYIVDDTLIYIGTSKGVYFSSDKGNNWTLRNTGLKYPVTCFAKNNNYLFAGDAYDVSFYNYNMQQWSRFASGIQPGYGISSLAASEQLLFASSQDGVFATSFSGIPWKNISTSTAVSLSIIADTIFAGFTQIGIFKADVNDFGFVLPKIPSAPSNLNVSIVGDSLQFKWNYSKMQNCTYTIVSCNSYNGSFRQIVARDIKSTSFSMLLPTDYKTNYYAVKTYDSENNLYSNLSNKVPVVLTGIKDQIQSSIKSLSIYPQPANDKLYYSFDESIIFLDIDIYDCFGINLLHINNFYSMDNYIDVSFLKSGVYFIKIKNGQSIYSSKFVKVD
jgi:hypothetical protein